METNRAGSTEAIHKELLNNSIAAFWGAIEIHNKPHFSYRYEVVVILVINAWELLLKSYIIDFLPSIKLLDTEGRSKPFDECVGCVFSNLTKEYFPIRDSIFALYKYRNEFTHYYTTNIDIVIFSLLIKNVQFYCRFIKKFYSIDLAEGSDLILLPIGFKKFVSPIDFLSDRSVLSTINDNVIRFLSTITKSIQELDANDVEESIIVDYNLYLDSVAKVKNSDLIVRIDPTSEYAVSITRKIEAATLTDNSEAVEVFSRSFSVPPGTEEEEVISWIALKKKDKYFLPRAESIWNKYRQRKALKLIDAQIQGLVYFSIINKVATFYWLQKLSSEEIIGIIEECIINTTDQFVFNYCEKILSHYEGKAVRKIESKVHSKMRRSVQSTYCYSKDSVVQLKIQALERCSNSKYLTPRFMEYGENELEIIVRNLVGETGGVESMEACLLDEILYSELMKQKNK